MIDAVVFLVTLALASCAAGILISTGVVDAVTLRSWIVVVAKACATLLAAVVLLGSLLTAAALVACGVFLVFCTLCFISLALLCLVAYTREVPDWVGDFYQLSMQGTSHAFSVVVGLYTQLLYRTASQPAHA